jgi:hypothetical protein
MDSFNYHLSATRILVECVFGKLKARFKVLHGVTYRRKHSRNARMLSCAVVLLNLLIDIGDQEEFSFNNDKTAREKARRQAQRVMGHYNENWDRSQEEIDLATESETHIWNASTDTTTGKPR